MIKVLKYSIQSIIIYTLFFFCKILGLNISRVLFSFIFSYFAPKFKSQKIIESNIHNFSKNITDEKKNQIISSMWKNYGLTFIEYIFLNIFRKKSSHIKIIGETNLKNVIHKNRPAIFVSGHFANFELMSMEITKKKIPLATIYRPLNNIFLNPFMEFLRRKYVCQNQIKKGISGVKEAINHLNKKNCIALMIDQRVSEGVKSNFFNRLALTTSIPAQIIKKYELEIVPVYIERKNKIYFNVSIDKPIKFNNKSEIIDITNRLNNIIEKRILSNPSQWIWTHNRWK